MAQIRSAVAEDIPRLVELYEQLTLEGSGEEPGDAVQTRHEQAFEEIMAFPGSELIVAEDSGNIIGTIMTTIVPNLTHGGYPWMIVENVVVESTLRGTGIGKLLMNYARDKAAAAGCYKIQLMSDKRRTEAHKFYQAIGYIPKAEGFRLYL